MLKKNIIFLVISALVLLSFNGCNMDASVPVDIHTADIRIVSGDNITMESVPS